MDGAGAGTGASNGCLPQILSLIKPCSLQSEPTAPTAAGSSAESHSASHMYAYTCVSHCKVSQRSQPGAGPDEKRKQLQQEGNPLRTASGLKKFLVRCTKAEIDKVSSEGRRSSSSSLSSRSNVKADDNLRHRRSAKTLRNAIVRAVK